jgi:hypothetical protein
MERTPVQGFTSDEVIWRKECAHCDFSRFLFLYSYAHAPKRVWFLCTRDTEIWLLVFSIRVLSISCKCVRCLWFVPDPFEIARKAFIICNPLRVLSLFPPSITTSLSRLHDHLSIIRNNFLVDVCSFTCNMYVHMRYARPSRLDRGWKSFCIYVVGLRGIYDPLCVQSRLCTTKQ